MGMTKPKKAKTGEELDALPEGAVVITNGQLYLKESRMGNSWWVTTNEQFYFRTKDIELPAKVIYIP